MGHRPASILEMHYGDYTRIDLLRERVVEQIESHYSTQEVVVDTLPMDSSMDTSAIRKQAMSCNS